MNFSAGSPWPPIYPPDTDTGRICPNMEQMYSVILFTPLTAGFQNAQEDEKRITQLNNL